MGICELEAAVWVCEDAWAMDVEASGPEGESGKGMLGVVRFLADVG